MHPRWVVDRNDCLLIIQIHSLQIKRKALEEMSVEWDDEQPIGLRFHDTVWYNAIREFRKLKVRKGIPSNDAVLDELIRQGLIDKFSVKCTPQMQQMLRYGAVLAGRLNMHLVSVKEQVSTT